MANFHEIMNSEELVLIDFSAEWCGPCKMMAPILKQLKSMLGNKTRILKVDIDKNQSLARQYNVQSVPTLILFKKGKITWRQSGLMQANELNSQIEKFL